VVVKTAPIGQTCTVANSTGPGTSGANVTNVDVSCEVIPSGYYTVSGNIIGLTGGQTVGLENSSTESGIITLSNGAFSFPAQADASSYNITVPNQPASPQTCSVVYGSGTISSANVTNVQVTCTGSQFYSIGGDVSGLNGTLSLLNNGGNVVVITDSGNFEFPQSVASGDQYNVTVGTQPLGQTCSVTTDTGTGTISNNDVNTVSVSCTTPATSYTVGGRISGLSKSGLTLLNNGGDSLPVASNATLFVFHKSIDTNAPYSVSIASQPNSQTCTVQYPTASGTMGNSPVTNVAVICDDTAHTVGGNITAQASFTGSVNLSLNGGTAQSFTVTSGLGSYIFKPPLLVKGAEYSVAITRSPTNQTCVFSGSSAGIISNTDVTLNVTCTTPGATLAASVPTLALYTYGKARTITITNTSTTVTAYSVLFSTSTSSSGTTISSNCADIAPGASCSITIIPGQSTANPYDTNPTPTTLTVQGNNTNALTIPINILDYANFYQGGYLFAIDDYNTPATGSIGGTVVATADQSTGIIWSSNGYGGAQANVSNDLIPGINQNSIYTNPSPTYSTDFTSFYSTTYISPSNPFTNLSFNQCNGLTDGGCNTANILTYYQTLITHWAGSNLNVAVTGTTTPTYYAAGVCSNYSGNTYTDWYLPSICEMLNQTSTSLCTNTSSMSTLSSGAGFTSSSYWSSTEGVGSPNIVSKVNLQFNTYANDDKNTANHVRCVRALTQP
jgi:hypothetical protein